MPIIPAPAALALPSVRTLADCADYSKTFEPFLPQLYLLPSQIYASITDVEALKTIYLSTSPAISGLAFAIATFPIFLIVSEINKNYSQVDRVWSIMPTLFNINYAVWTRLSGLPTTRVDHVLAFSLLWSARLTFNYWRRGGYEIGSEDYRWELIKGKIGGVGFFLLNVFFIASVQPVSDAIYGAERRGHANHEKILLWAVTLPTYLILLASKIEPEMATSDFIFARVLIGLVVFEYFADQQQWNFQQAKKEYQKTAKVPQGWTRAQMDRGFVTSGLWSFSRHPNFAAEQSIWITLYAWSCVRSHAIGNWTIGGVIAYILVFSGSTPLTEWISGGKYPEYKLYQKRVGMFVPGLLSGRWNEEEMVKVAQQDPNIKAKKQG